MQWSLRFARQQNPRCTRTNLIARRRIAWTNAAYPWRPSPAKSVWAVLSSITTTWVMVGSIVSLWKRHRTHGLTTTSLHRLVRLGENACPPEDVGGPHGYEHFLACVTDPNSDEHIDARRWVGGVFDPAGFDLNRVNRRPGAEPDVGGDRPDRSTRRISLGRSSGLAVGRQSGQSHSPRSGTSPPAKPRSIARASGEYIYST